MASLRGSSSSRNRTRFLSSATSTLLIDGSVDASVVTSLDVSFPSTDGSIYGSIHIGLVVFCLLVGHGAPFNALIDSILGDAEAPSSFCYACSVHDV